MNMVFPTGRLHLIGGLQEARMCKGSRDIVDR